MKTKKETPQKHCYINGVILPENDVKISPHDIGLLRGYGVFDVMRTTEDGTPFLLDDHWERLKKSAHELEMAIPITKDEFTKTIEALLQRNNMSLASIRTVLTGGISPDSFSIGKMTFLIMTEKFKKPPKEAYQNGASTITVDHRRHIPHVKTINYIVPIRHNSKRNKAKALEIIYVKDHIVYEASTSNIFIVRKNTLITPKEKILKGITRKTVLKIASPIMAIEERKMTENELFHADEVLLTASNKGVVPVTKINDKKIGNGTVGKHTKNLMKQYNQFIKDYRG
ncbi:MAG: aminotransferase class IV [Candidatus Moranbacteria bacterium]|nr:aminotransferase class IV [Candidatus Moranbacteria bacterium]